jgi:hypothetical protein
VNITNNNVDKYISICNINIRSVRNKLHFLQNFADEYDILCVTESHLDVKINNDDLSLDFFSKTFIRKDRNSSGVDFSYILKMIYLLNDTDEIIWIKVRARGQTFLLCNTYRPEWTDNEYWTRLNHEIGVGYQVNDNIVILGDFNSDLFITNNNKLIETMMLFSLTTIISKPTRTTAHSNTLLDPIIISDTMNYIYSDVLKIPSEISDHDASGFLTMSKECFCFIQTGSLVI